MKVRAVASAVLLAVGLAPAATAEPPNVDHQPSPCMVPDKPASLCASITDDGQVAAARIYFRPAGDKFYSFVDMVFGGLSFCGTLPGARAGKVQVLEYYVQAVDDQFQAQRTSTFQLRILPAGQCEFPQVVKGKEPLAIKVFATHKKQGAKLDDAFDKVGVTFVPLGSK